MISLPTARSILIAFCKLRFPVLNPRFQADRIFLSCGEKVKMVWHTDPAYLVYKDPARALSIV